MNIVERYVANGEFPEPWANDIPAGVRDDLIAYAFERRRASGFVMAVVSNDLREAVARADPPSCASFRAIVSWCRVNLPAGSWGSPSAVRAWLEGGEL